MSAPHDYGRVLDIEASLTYMQERSERRAWHVAYAALAVAVLSAVALALMVPFYRVVPLPIEVDRLTGESQVIDVLDARTYIRRISRISTGSRHMCVRASGMTGGCCRWTTTACSS